MDHRISKRDFLKLAGIGGVVVASALRGRVPGTAAAANAEDFTFVQLSDSHWGFNGPQANPDAQGTLKKAVAATASGGSPSTRTFMGIRTSGPTSGGGTASSYRTRI